MSAQNYALLSMRPRQPFDFSGRTGTISYNVDALTEAGLSYWTSLAVTDTPQAGAANSSQGLGMLPDNGVLVNFDNDCSNPGNEVGVSGELFGGAVPWVTTRASPSASMHNAIAWRNRTSRITGSLVCSSRT